MDAVRYRYSGNALLGDYARAAAGFVVCVAPLLFTPMSWVSVLLAGLALLFGVFGAKTAIRQRTEFAVDEEGIAALGPFGRAVRWAEVNRFKLAFYATKRDKNSGWMEATVGGPGGKVRVDSGLEGFHDIVDRAARAAAANRVDFSTSTRANLRAMDVHLPEMADAGPAGGVGR